MKICENCVNYVWGDHVTPFPEICVRCKFVDVDGEMVPSNWKAHPMTNADRIRAMSDEELAEWISDCGIVCETCVYSENCDEPYDREKCLNGILKRLQQPAEEEQNAES